MEYVLLDHTVQPAVVSRYLARKGNIQIIQALLLVMHVQLDTIVILLSQQPSLKTVREATIVQSVLALIGSLAQLASMALDSIFKVNMNAQCVMQAHTVAPQQNPHQQAHAPLAITVPQDLKTASEKQPTQSQAYALPGLTVPQQQVTHPHVRLARSIPLLVSIM